MVKIFDLLLRELIFSNWCLMVRNGILKVGLLNIEVWVTTQGIRDLSIVNTRVVLISWGFLNAILHGVF